MLSQLDPDANLPRGVSRRDFLSRGALIGGAAAFGLPALLAACSSSTKSTAAGAGVVTAAPTAAPKRGGTLRVALAGMGSTDTLDPANSSDAGAWALCRQVFDTLTGYGTDGKLEMLLAEAVTPESPDTWTVRLREAEWHDGKPVTADDVIFTFQRIFAQKLSNIGAVPFMDPKQITKLDSRTVRFKFTSGAMVFPDTLAQINQAIVPVGFNPKKPIGSGAFKLVSYTPGQRATFARNDHYWIPSQPYVDKLILIAVSDSTAQVDALTAGQADLAPDLDATLTRRVLSSGSGYTVFGYPSSATLTIPMNVKVKPLDDVRVRQALRLAVDRKQLIAQVYAGQAAVADDYFGPYDPAYTRTLPQREQDIDQAKSLLKRAGHDSVNLQLTAAPINPFAVHQNQVFVQQVKAAGFNVDFRQVDVATYYGPQYGTYPLSLSLWGTLNILAQSGFTLTKGSPYNATHWQDAQYNNLYNQAMAQADSGKRADLIHAMQKIEYDRGPYVVTQFHHYLTGYSSKVTGYHPYPNGLPGSDYRFREMGFKA